MHQAVFTNVEITGTGPAAPIVGTSIRNVVLESIDTGIAGLPHGLHLAINIALFDIEGLELPAAVMNNSDGRGEAKRERTTADRQGVIGIANPTTDHGINVHVKVGVFRQQLQFFIQHLQAFFGDIVRHYVINTDLKMFKPGAIQPLNALGGEQVAVGDQARESTVLSHPGDDVVKLGVQ